MLLTENGISRNDRILLALLVGIGPNALAFLLMLSYSYVSSANASIFFAAFFLGLPGTLAFALSPFEMLIYVASLVNSLIDTLIVYKVQTSRSWLVMYFAYLLLTRFCALVLLAWGVAMYT